MRPHWARRGRTIRRGLHCTFVPGRCRRHSPPRSPPGRTRESVLRRSSHGPRPTLLRRAGRPVGRGRASGIVESLAPLRVRAGGCRARLPPRKACAGESATALPLACPRRVRQAPPPRGTRPARSGALVHPWGCHGRSARTRSAHTPVERASLGGLPAVWSPLRPVGLSAARRPRSLGWGGARSRRPPRGAGAPSAPGSVFSLTAFAASQLPFRAGRPSARDGECSRASPAGAASGPAPRSGRPAGLPGPEPFPSTRGEQGAESASLVSMRSVDFQKTAFACAEARFLLQPRRTLNP